MVHSLTWYLAGAKDDKGVHAAYWGNGYCTSRGGFNDRNDDVSSDDTNARYLWITWLRKYQWVIR